MHSSQGGGGEWGDWDREGDDSKEEKEKEKEKDEEEEEKEAAITTTKDKITLCISFFCCDKIPGSRQLTEQSLFELVVPEGQSP